MPKRKLPAKALPDPPYSAAQRKQIKNALRAIAPVRGKFKARKIIVREPSKFPEDRILHKTLNPLGNVHSARIYLGRRRRGTIP